MLKIQALSWLLTRSTVGKVGVTSWGGRPEAPPGLRAAAHVDSHRLVVPNSWAAGLEYQSFKGAYEINVFD